MADIQHPDVPTEAAHTAFRYVSADKSAHDTAIGGDHTNPDEGLLALQVDTRRIQYLSAAGNPGTWATLYPGYTATGSAPGVSDDVDSGYEPGHIWVDTSGTAVYVCLSNSSGAADWNQIDSTASVTNLQTAYAGGNTIDASGSSIAFTNNNANNNALLTLGRSPAGSQSGAVLDVTAGANLTGPAINITNGGSGAAITWSAGSLLGPAGAATLSSNTTSETTPAVTLSSTGSFDASSGEQTMLYVPATINASGTAGHTALHVDVTATATGSGEQSLLKADVGGTTVFRVDHTGQTLLPDGTESLPALAFLDEPDTGIRKSTGGTWKVVLNGADRFTFSSNSFQSENSSGAKIQNETSSDTNPTLVPNRGSSSTGIGGVSGEISFCTSGVQSGYVNTNNQLVWQDGTNLLPSVTFDGDSDSGYYLVSAGALGVAIGGVGEYGFSATAFYPLTSNANSLGQSAYRFDDIFAQGKLDLSQTLITSVSSEDRVLIQDPGTASAGVPKHSGMIRLRGSTWDTTPTATDRELQMAWELECASQAGGGGEVVLKENFDSGGWVDMVRYRNDHAVVFERPSVGTDVPGSDYTAVGVRLLNPTAATSGNPQNSPALRFTGSGWDSDEGGGAAKSVDFAFQIETASDTAGGGDLVLSLSHDGGTWYDVFRADEQQNIAFANSVEIDGALNHDGTHVGFYGTTPVVQSAAYTRTATVVESRTLAASASASATNNNNVLAALIADLQATGLIA